MTWTIHLEPRLSLQIHKSSPPCVQNWRQHTSCIVPLWGLPDTRPNTGAQKRCNTGILQYFFFENDIHKHPEIQTCIVGLPQYDAPEKYNFRTSAVFKDTLIC